MAHAPTDRQSLKNKWLAVQLAGLVRHAGAQDVVAVCMTRQRLFDSRFDPAGGGGTGGDCF